MKLKALSISLSVLALTLLVSTPAHAANWLKIRNNGADSTNRIELKTRLKQKTTQVNQTEVVNGVEIKANTGGNTANKNTGGDVSITSGDIFAGVVITNEGSSNTNHGDDCGCVEEEVKVDIKGNGADSDNRVKFESLRERIREQLNQTSFASLVGADLETGDNESNKNTGSEGSDPSTETGDIEVAVEIHNSGNSNTN